MEEIVKKIDNGQLTPMFFTERSYVAEQIANVADGPLMPLAQVVRDKSVYYWAADYYRNVRLPGLLRDGKILFADMSNTKFEIAKIPEGECTQFHLTPVTLNEQPWAAVAVSRHFRHFHELNIRV